MLKDMTIDAESIVSYVEKLVTTPSPTGYTKLVEQYLIENAQKKQIAFEHTRKGAVLYKFETEEAQLNVMFAAHVDTLGAIVKEVKRKTLKLSSIGGYPIMYVIGDYCRIHTFDDNIYEGTILPDNPAAHVNRGLGRMKLELEKLSVRVDLALKKKKDSLKNYIDVGNFVSFDPKFCAVNGFIKSRHLDDKASAAVLLYVADVLKERSADLSRNVYLFFHITEETGQGIAGFPHIDDLIIVDMGVVGDGAAGDEFHVSICAKDSSGPYNYELTQQFITLSKEHKIAYKTDIFPYYASDGSAALRAGGDVRVALIGPGVSASHGYERTHIDSLTNTAKLLLCCLQ
jgi:putative aminopeptidase FrvX